MDMQSRVAANQGAVVGIWRSLRRDEGPQSGLASLRMSEVLFRIAGTWPNEWTSHVQPSQHVSQSRANLVNISMT